MTREEAREWFENALNNNDFFPETEDAFKVAIEALSAEAVQGFRGGKITPKEMLNGTVLIPQHQWLEMERELAELKSKFESVETEWIPCSERLPKENEHVGNVYKYYLIQDEYGDMHVAHLSRRGWETIESIKVLRCDVLAWMPLPKPYDERREP